MLRNRRGGVRHRRERERERERCKEGDNFFTLFDLCDFCHPTVSWASRSSSLYRSMWGWTRTGTVLVSKKGGGSEGFGLKSFGSEKFGFEKFGFEKF